MSIRALVVVYSTPLTKMLPNPVIGPEAATGDPDPSIPAVSEPWHEVRSSATPTRATWTDRFTAASGSILDVVEPGAQPHELGRVVRCIGAGFVHREPRVDPFQECLALLLQKTLKLRQRARVDAVVHRSPLEPCRGLGRTSQVMNVGLGYIGDALAPHGDELLVHGLRDVAALERLESSVPA